MDEARGISCNIHVVAGDIIPYGSWYGPVPEIEFQTIPDLEPGINDSSIKIISKCGILTVSSHYRKSWHHYLHPARDIHEQNLQLFKSRDDKMYIRAIRDIGPDEIMRCWYDETLAWNLSVPYLTPANILGIDRYCCTSCHNEFTFPNHLKLHIMYHCLCYESKNKNLCSTPLADNVSSPLNRHGHHCCVDSMVNIDINAEKCKFQVSSYNASAYREDYKPRASRYTLKASFELIPNVPTYAVSADRKQHLINEINRNMYQVSPYPDIDEEEPIEILSKTCSITSSNKGHLCVFCGKLYSRKYGLKIHLRTHTGYKPLKCKTCLRAFGDPSNLNKHIRLHAQGSTPYQCTYCGKILVRRRDLVRHLKSRHPDERSQ